MFRLFPCLFLTLAASTAHAQSDSYLDDRSTPEALIESLYNAINADEYSRAWSYFADAPADSLDAYSAGFADTDHVEVEIGSAEAEGTAGSTYWRLPFALRSVSTEGEATTYRGCYTLRLADPAVQGTPFQPMVITDRSVEETDSLIENAMPSGCADDGTPLATAEAAPETGEDSSTSRLMEASFRRLYADRCSSLQQTDETGETGEVESEFYPLDSPETEDAPAQNYVLGRFVCDAGAYNMTDIWLLSDESGFVEPVAFAKPQLDIRYSDPEETSLESATIAGWEAAETLVNSGFDEQSRTITDVNKWRGIGDAYTSGSWVFRDGMFVLTSYEVDPLLDEQIDPQTVFDAAAPSGN